jgi:hypothetical protein
MRDCVEGLLDAFGNQQRIELGTRFIRMGANMVSQPERPREAEPDNTSPPEVGNTEEQEFKRVLLHGLRSRFDARSATMVYDEYNGEGDFIGKPIVGGLKGLDEKYNTKWRRGDAAYQKAYSRIKQVVSCVETRMKEQNRTKEEVLEELDELFAEKECRNLTAMVARLQQLGWMSKRVRTIGQQEAH